MQNRESTFGGFKNAVLTYFADLLQVLTIIGMERPISFSAEDIRDEKVSLL
jgi:hypothetical protein